MKIGLIRCLQIERDMLLDDSLFESYKRTCRSVSRYPFQTHVGIHHGRIRNTGPSSALRTATILFYLSNRGTFHCGKCRHGWDFPYRTDCRKH
jgi:hypothetical protein